MMNELFIVRLGDCACVKTKISKKKKTFLHVQHLLSPMPLSTNKMILTVCYHLTFSHLMQAIGLKSSWRYEKHQITLMPVMPYSCTPPLNPTATMFSNLNRKAEKIYSAYKLKPRHPKEESFFFINSRQPLEHLQ
jgi:hypothetical protein